jgi:hypothetical protein
VLDPYLDAWRLGEGIENLRGLALGKLGAVEIDADRNAAIGGARERLHDGPARQDIGRHVDFMLGAIDKHNVDVFQVFRRRVVNDRHEMRSTAGLAVDLVALEVPRTSQPRGLKRQDNDLIVIESGVQACVGCAI